MNDYPQMLSDPEISGEDKRRELAKRRIIHCRECPLRGRPVVPGSGKLGTGLLLVGEAPGRHEAKISGLPFTGDAGVELNSYLTRAGLSRDAFFVTNTVKCWPPSNRDPTPEEKFRCSGWLEEEITLARPDIIGALGAAATRHFLFLELDFDPTMEMTHGLHYQIDLLLGQRDVKSATVVPCYHPALGLHDTRRMSIIFQDYESLARAVRGDGEDDPKKVWSRSGEFIDPEDITLWELTDPDEIETAFRVAVERDLTYIALDTESLADGSPFCVSGALEGTAAFMIAADNARGLESLAGFVATPGVLTILHNSLWDLPILAAMGIRPAAFVDTMIMSYLLGDLPQGLKPLSYRLLGARMTKYQDMIDEASRDLALNYLLRAQGGSYPDPDEEIGFKPDGEIHIKRPQNIAKKIKRALNDYAKDPGVDLRARWSKMDGTDVVESRLGPMPEADLSFISRDEAVDYACEDALNTFRIYPLLRAQIAAAELLEILWIDCALVPMVNDMQTRGMLVDQIPLLEIGELCDDRMDELNAEIDKLAGRRVNPASPPQVKAFLKSQGVRVKNTAQETLKVLSHPAARKVVSWREYQKLKGTYVDNLVERSSHGDGRVRGRFKLTRTATGRIAMEDPNLMNIPTRTEEGRRIRGAFRAAPGFKLMSCDYAQIEMRVAAHCSGDKLMLDIFRNDKDFHSITASQAFGIPIDQVDELQHRYPAKRVSFGVLYAITGQGLLTQLEAAGAQGWTLQKCEDFIKEWFRVYSGVASWMESVRSHAKRFGFVKDMFGRRRLTPGVKSAHKRIREEALREACNAPVQSGAQGIIKVAMGQLIPVYRQFNAWPLLQIHDDIIFEIPEETLDRAVPAIVKTMENAVKLSLPTPVDPKVGDRWNSLKEYKPGN